jgi:outer membrane lipoprotein SlyB
LTCVKFLGAFSALQIFTKLWRALVLPVLGFNQVTPGGNKMKQYLLLLIGILSVACTTTDEIIIDRKGVDEARYQADLAECQAYSSEVRTGEKAAKGAASGAVVGGLIGAAVGNSRDAQRGAGAGAVTGAAKGVSAGERDEVQVVKQCLRGRGYRVLN